ncbi:hypothetical protein BDN67DRAFT_384655 [Paxillus ammoniavirescens]|nr:hypothetical protein BDN67DRAFT_384655 [Paxillus ammoniavirescens]
MGLTPGVRDPVRTAQKDASVRGLRMDVNPHTTVRVLPVHPHRDLQAPHLPEGTSPQPVPQLPGSPALPRHRGSLHLQRPRPAAPPRLLRRPPLQFLRWLHQPPRPQKWPRLLQLQWGSEPPFDSAVLEDLVDGRCDQQRFDCSQNADEEQGR